MMLADYQCLLSSSALVLKDASLLDIAENKGKRLFSDPSWAPPVLSNFPPQSTRASTTVCTPDFNACSQRYIQALSAQLQFGSQAGCMPCLRDSLLPPRLAPAQTQFRIYSPQNLSLFSSLTDSSALKTKLIIFHAI